MSSPDKVWVQYAYSDISESDRYLDPMFKAFFVNTLPPGSDFVQSTKVLGFREIGKNSAIVNLDSGGFKHWIGFRRMQNGWKITLDESEILETLSQDWHRQRFGNIQFVTRSVMTPEQIKLATKFSTTAQQLEEQFNIKIPLVNYYVASTSKEAYSIVGQSVHQAGRGRLRAVKTYDRYDHIHEFIHVLAMEIGLINPYFDEGLATAFEDGFRFKNRIECLGALSNLRSIFPAALSGESFNELNNKGSISMYGVAQATMRYWIKKKGIESVKNVLRRTMEHPTDFRSILEMELGSIEDSLAGTESELKHACETFL